MDMTKKDLKLLRKHFLKNNEILMNVRVSQGAEV